MHSIVSCSTHSRNSIHVCMITHVEKEETQEKTQKKAQKEAQEETQKIGSSTFTLMNR